MPSDRVFDVAIIGGGIAGVIHLHYARKMGLDAVVLERRGGVGGLWRELPPWQDIQIGLADWSIGDVPLTGPMQPQVLANIEAWVTHFALADGIRLNSPVQRARHVANCWEVDTPQGTIRARHLVAATGAHNSPVIPEVRRDRSTVRELHSSALRDPSELTGRDVLVVGGGASAFDLLDQCLEQGARRIMWVYRGLRWFTPTRKPKAIAGSVRPYAKMQASGMTIAEQNEAIGADMLARYEKFGIQAIQPSRPIDLHHDQLIPGRARMLSSFGSLERYPGQVESIADGEVVLADGTRLAVDVLLWGTGYATDLSYFDEPRIASITTTRRLSERCGCLFRSLDAPDLYFPAVGLDGIGAAPWAAAVIARSIMSHIHGTARLDMEQLGHKTNHFEIARYLALRDPGSFTKDRGWDYFRNLALTMPDDQAYPLP